MKSYQMVTTKKLEVGYLEWVPTNAAPFATVILLHGWPDCPEGWSDVALRLSDAGYRVLAPALRGFGPTTFRDPHQQRSGQLAALGRDLVELIESLRLDKPILVGHDWGARAAGNACALQPGIASHLVLMSVGYGTNNPNQDLSLQQVRNYWYHWYMATSRGEQTVRRQRVDFTRMMWDTWAPTGWYAEPDFQIAIKAFDNPDWADIVLHSYQHRWGFAEGDPAYKDDELKLNPAPMLETPTLVLHGEVDTCNHPDTSANKAQYFSGHYQRETLPGVGHFPHREDPELVAQLLLSFFSKGSALPE